jgi:hypothetical protein
MRAVKREIARILTVARERELQALYEQALAMLNEAADMPEVAAPTVAPTAAEAEQPAPRRRGLFSRS